MKKILATVASACTALAVGAAVQLTASVYDDDTGRTYTGSGVFVEVTYSWWQGEEQETGVDDVAVTVGDYNNVSYAIVRGCITNDSIDRDKCKWKIASDRAGSGNTRNIGGIVEIDNLVAGKGPFSDLGEDVFDDYWMNYFNAADARNAGIGAPRYHNLATYKEYLDKQQNINKKLRK